ncbi:hypothetical protein SGHV083 [Glossina pallidipes salivary gland hypertrophy virus]|uniref:Uncharacterized protein n=1 Tax=Glossina hytrovirus (isolate Glossina pallidipes/Ethiopia/Seibersdorf/-) TaxID=379529 RepID=B0YLN7_GHVS|nr:hypothetical protein SGHV083 [Glossina pallidipes salivary gland hypertrophy virus]ABQ08856.1 hypothetical protein SGHV083 [Glossina pallidipes salivary gland hypertrophy virus]
MFEPELNPLNSDVNNILEQNITYQIESRACNVFLYKNKQIKMLPNRYLLLPDMTTGLHELPSILPLAVHYSRKNYNELYILDQSLCEFINIVLDSVQAIDVFTEKFYNDIWLKHNLSFFGTFILYNLLPLEHFKKIKFMDPLAVSNFSLMCTSYERRKRNFLNNSRLYIELLLRDSVPNPYVDEARILTDGNITEKLFVYLEIFIKKQIFFVHSDCFITLLNIVKPEIYDSMVLTFLNKSPEKVPYNIRLKIIKDNEVEFNALTTETNNIAEFEYEYYKQQHRETENDVSLYLPQFIKELLPFRIYNTGELYHYLMLPHVQEAFFYEPRHYTTKKRTTAPVIRRKDRREILESDSIINNLSKKLYCQFESFEDNRYPTNEVMNQINSARRTQFNKDNEELRATLNEGKNGSTVFDSELKYTEISDSFESIIQLINEFLDLNEHDKNTGTLIKKNKITLGDIILQFLKLDRISINNDMQWISNFLTFACEHTFDNIVNIVAVYIQRFQQFSTENFNPLNLIDIIMFLHGGIVANNLQDKKGTANTIGASGLIGSHSFQMCSYTPPMNNPIYYLAQMQLQHKQLLNITTDDLLYIQNLFVPRVKRIELLKNLHELQTTKEDFDPSGENRYRLSTIDFNSLIPLPTVNTLSENNTKLENISLMNAINGYSNLFLEMNNREIYNIPNVICNLNLLNSK